MVVGLLSGVLLLSALNIKINLCWTCSALLCLVDNGNGNINQYLSLN